VSSPEPKARQTLEPCGKVIIDHRLVEVARVEPYDHDFRARRLAYVTGTDHPGWEPRAEVIARFDASIRQMLGYASDRRLVLATHGMAMTVWLASV
jgi:broad specificity phosphatase PhoE